MKEELSIANEKNGQNWLFWAFILGVSLPVYSSFINIIFTKIMGANSYDTIVSYGCFAVVVLFGYVNSESNQKNYIIVQYLKCLAVVFFLYQMSLLLHLEYTPYFEHYKQKMNMNSAFGFLTAFLIDDEKTIKKAIKYIAYVIFFSMVFVPFIKDSIMSITSDGDDNFTGYMVFGYQMLPAVIMLFYLFFTEKKTYHLIFALIGSAELFIYANRGSVLTVILFIVLYQLLCTKSEKKMRNIFILVVVGVIIYFAMQPENLLKINSMLNGMGIHSRNLVKLIDSSVQETGRSHIYEPVLDKLKEGDLVGLGVFGDRYLLNGSYPHNFIYEILLQFGWIVGLGIVVILFIAFYRILTHKKYESMRGVSLVFVTMIMVKLMLSSTYVQEYWFYFLIGYMLNLKRVIKNQSETREEASDKKDL